MHSFNYVTYDMGYYLELLTAIVLAGFWMFASAHSTHSPESKSEVFNSLTLPPSSLHEECLEFVVVSDQHGFLQWLNCMLRLLNFSGWRDASRENSRKTSVQEMSPAMGDTEVR